MMVLIAGMFMSILDISVINVALPAVQNEFGATTSDAQWVITGYALAEGVVVPTSAWIGDRFGLSRVYNLALLGFTGGSAFCGLAWSLNSLVIFRVIQGLLGGFLPAVTMSILLRIVPRERFGAALGLYGLGAVFAPAVGPALGGYLVEYVNWRLIFFINLPIGIIGVIAAILVLPSLPKQVGRRFDMWGFITVAAGLFALLLAVSKGEDWRWSSYRILGLITFSVLSLALFVVIQLEVDAPLLDLRVFRYWAFTHSILLTSLLSMAMFSVVFLVPQFLQRGQGLGALDAGLVLLPPALVMAALMPIAGRIYDRIGSRWPAVIGFTLAAVSSYQLHTLTLDTSRWDITWMLMLQYGGLGLGMMPIMSAGLSAIPVERSSSASALSNVAQRVSAAFGVAVFTAILTVQQAVLMAGRGALLPANTPIPHLGPPGTPDWLGLYAVYHENEQRVFVGAIDNLFLLITAFFILSILGSLLLRSRPAVPPGRSSPAKIPAQKIPAQAPAKVSPTKHHAAERDPVPTPRTPARPRPSAPSEPERITVTVSTAADPHAATAEPAHEEAAHEVALAEPAIAHQTRDQAASEHEEPAVTTVQATGDRTSEHLHTSADELDTSPARIAQLSEQMATLRQQATDLAAAQTELAAKLHHVRQQHRRAEDAEQQVSQATGHIVEHRPAELTGSQPEPAVSPATVQGPRNHGKQRLPEQHTRARGHTGGQKPKLGPRQIKLARQMYDELDKNGKRRYTTKQIADAFGVTPTTIYRHLRGTSSKRP